ncbi:protein of unknown function [Xenorhabdus nematophila AN6/1]|nr:protein of unknown function [Xenorhabdus nematophila AN6/1]
MRLQVDNTTPPCTSGCWSRSSSARPIVSGEKTTCSRKETGAVLWLIPSANKVILTALSYHRDQIHDGINNYSHKLTPFIRTLIGWAFYLMRQCNKSQSDRSALIYSRIFGKFSLN